MKSRKLTVSLILGVLTWLFATQTGWSFYNPSTGRWLNRDPMEERGGLNLNVFTSNNALDKIDHLGLASNSTPGTPHVSDDRHNNYLIFHISCPVRFKVSHVRVVYDNDAMIEGLIRRKGSNWYRQWEWDKNRRNLMEDLDNSFGGLQYAGSPNCLGLPVEVHAYMRTRLVSPNWKFELWRFWNAMPDPEITLGLYQENVKIYSTCEDCCGRGRRR